MSTTKIQEEAPLHLPPRRRGPSPINKVGLRPAFFFRWIPASAGIIGFGLASACTTQADLSVATADQPSIATTKPAAEQTVRQFVAAYNNKDLDGMMALADDDIVWLSVDGDNTAIMTNGADAMREEMKGYFGPDANPKSAIEILKSHGNFVTTLERAYWMQGGEEKSKASFAVYEVIEGKVRRVWYYPASE